MAKQFTITQAAEAKGVTRQAIHQAIQSGKLTAVKQGSILLIKRNKRFDAYTPRGQAATPAATTSPEQAED